MTNRQRRTEDIKAIVNSAMALDNEANKAGLLNPQIFLHGFTRAELFDLTKEFDLSLSLQQSGNGRNYMTADIKGYKNITLFTKD